MKKYNDKKIDFVVLWVDPSDKEWQKQRAKYSGEADKTKDIDDREERYRDWGLFRYWFRSIEKNAPWVNKVHLVTCGHIPEWLNVNHPKLNIVKHSDFMPKEALPTFNSSAIMVSLANIPGLSEQFVLFNDDCFLLKKTKPTDFFKNGLPVNTMSFFANMPCQNGNRFYQLVSRDIEIINTHFDFKDCVKKNFLKYISLKQKEWLVFTVPALAYNQFIGFRNFHIATSYLKSTFKEVAKAESDRIAITQLNRFRVNEEDINEWLCNYWQFAKGSFIQRSSHFGRSFSIDDRRVPAVIRKKKYKTICLNDNDNAENNEQVREDVASSFECVVPQRSSYEK